MKVNELKIKVEKLCKVLDRKPLIPILDYILIEDGMMTTSNHLVHYSTPCSLSVSGITIPAKRFKALLASLAPSCSIELRHNGENVVEALVDGVKKATYRNLSYSHDYPKTPKPEKTIGHLKSEDVPTLKAMVPFVSNDELREKLTRVYMNGLFAATDAHRLIYKKHVSNLIDTELLIHPKVADLLDAQDYDISVGESDMIFFLDGQNVIAFRNYTEEKYPDIYNVIPKEENLTRKVVLDRKLLISELKQSLCFANKTTHMIAVGFSGRHEMSIECEDIDFDSDFKTTLPVLTQEIGDPEWQKIGTNAKFFLSALNVNSRLPNVELAFQKPNTAFTVDDMVLVMPIMLNNFS